MHRGRRFFRDLYVQFRRCVRRQFCDRFLTLRASGEGCWDFYQDQRAEGYGISVGINRYPCDDAFCRRQYTRCQRSIFFQRRVANCLEGLNI